MTAIQQNKLRNQVFRAPYTASISTTRPSDIEIYSAGDVIGGASNGRRACTMTAANPGVFTLVGHGFGWGQRVVFTTAGTLPTGIVSGTSYYVKYVSADTFQVTAAPVSSGGTGIDCSAGSPSLDDHTCTATGFKGSAVLAFENMGIGGDMVVIQQSLFSLNLTAVDGSATTNRLHLYSKPPPSALLDNAAWSLTAADLGCYLGYIDLGTLVDVGPVLVVQASGIGRYFVAPTSTIYGYLVTTAAYTTPTAGSVYSIKLAGTSA